MNPRHLILILAALILALAGCGRDRGPATETADDVQPVTIEEIAPRELEDYITVSGKLDGITSFTMSSETSGRIVEIYKKLGDPVKKGERIGRVQNEVYQYRLDQAEAALASAQSSYETAQRNLEWAEAALEEELVSQAEYKGILSAYNGAKAGLDGAKAGLEAAQEGVSGSYFTAPQAGTITNLNLSLGQLIGPGAPVATITDASRLIIKTGVGESQISKLKRGQSAEISYPERGITLKGFVRGFGISPLPNSATYPVEIELARGGSLLPGMVVSARILTGRYTDLLYTSITNLSNEFGAYYAWVVDAENKASKRKVTLDRIIGGDAVIASGLSAGEMIVTSGGENLEEGGSVEIRNAP
ncbi:MAG: efflux RND transporter periplasmic adaptor subunit [Candidatus Syntrophosphaera sp.]